MQILELGELLQLERGADLTNRRTAVMYLKCHATVFVSSSSLMKTFIAVRSNCLVQSVGQELGRMQDCYIAKIDPDFTEIHLLV